MMLTKKSFHRRRTGKEDTQGKNYNKESMQQVKMTTLKTITNDGEELVSRKKFRVEQEDGKVKRGTREVELNLNHRDQLSDRQKMQRIYDSIREREEQLKKHELQREAARIKQELAQYNSREIEMADKGDDEEEWTDEDDERRTLEKHDGWGRRGIPGDRKRKYTEESEESDLSVESDERSVNDLEGSDHSSKQENGSGENSLAQKQ